MTEAKTPLFHAKMQTKEADSTQHRNGIAVAEKKVKELGYALKPLPTINSHVPGMTACRPDVFGVKEDTGEEVLVEVETSTSFAEKHAEHQRDTFVFWAKENATRRAYLCVPKGALVYAALKLSGYNDVWYF